MEENLSETIIVMTDVAEKKTILSVEWLSKTFTVDFRKVPVLHDVTLHIEQWEIYGFLWPNGAGKTTSLKSILWFITPTTGDISFFWEKAVYSESLYRRIWYAPEQAIFYDFLSGKEFVVYMGKLSGMSAKDAAAKADILLEKVWIADAANKRMTSYSKWMKQRAILAASLVHDPEIVFWDEPMSGLDPIGRANIKKLMKELKEEGKTIFFNTHILPDVQEVADRFSIIHKGNLIYEDQVANIEGSLEEFFIEKVSG